MSAPEGGMKKARIILIAAMSRTRVIGVDGGLPWKLPGDLAHFRRRTLGKPLILGRKTFESLGGPLPGREMIVLSRRGVGESHRVWSAGSKAVALELAYERAELLGTGEICVIGGGEVFGEFLADADGLVLTWVEGEFGGDVFFPEFCDRDWVEVSCTRPVLRKGGGAGYEVMELRRGVEGTATALI